MKQISSFAPGKVIISGEHSVIYGHSALVASINLGIETTFVNGLLPIQHQHNRYLQHIFNIWQNKGYPFFNNFYLDLHSNLPQNFGLGSSASFASAIFQTLGKWFDIKLTLDELFKLVWQAENSIHGISSGLDPKAVVFQKLIAYQKNNQDVQINRNREQNFLLINSGRATESTGEMVSFVKKNPANLKITDQIGGVTKQIIEQLKVGKPYEELIKINHQLLNQLGVVSHQAKLIIDKVENMGGVAKITGAGGIKSGSGMILAFHRDLELLTSLAKTNHWPYLQIMI